MDISFKTRKLEKILNSEVLIKKNYTKCHRQVMRRMAMLAAASSLKEVPVKPPERRHQLEGNRQGQFAVDLKHPFRLVFKPNHDPEPRTETGEWDLGGITAIVIIAVEDYH